MNKKTIEIRDQKVEYFFENDVMWVNLEDFTQIFPITINPQWIRDKKYIASQVLLGWVYNADTGQKTYTRLFTGIIEAYHQHLADKSETKYDKLKRNLFGDDVA